MRFPVRPHSAGQACHGPLHHLGIEQRSGVRSDEPRGYREARSQTGGRRSGERSQVTGQGQEVTDRKSEVRLQVTGHREVTGRMEVTGHRLEVGDKMNEDRGQKVMVRGGGQVKPRPP